MLLEQGCLEMLSSALKELSDLDRQRESDVQISLSKNLLTWKEKNGPVKHS